MQGKIEVVTVRNLEDRISISTTIENNIEDMKIDVNILYKMIEDINKRNRNLWVNRISRFI